MSQQDVLENAPEAHTKGPRRSEKELLYYQKGADTEVHLRKAKVSGRKMDPNDYIPVVEVTEFTEPIKNLDFTTKMQLKAEIIKKEEMNLRFGDCDRYFIVAVIIKYLPGPAG